MISIQTSPAARSEQQSPRKNVTQPAILPRFGSEVDVEALTGLSRKTLQKDRQVGRSRFPWYKSGKRVHYDLDEVKRIIRGTRTEASVQNA
jgi:hypothetical protein